MQIIFSPDYFNSVFFGLPMINSLLMSFSQIISDHITPLPKIRQCLLIVLTNKNESHQTRQCGIDGAYLFSSSCIMFSHAFWASTTTFFQLFKPAMLSSWHKSFKHTVHFAWHTPFLQTMQIPVILWTSFPGKAFLGHPDEVRHPTH